MAGRLSLFSPPHSRARRLAPAVVTAVYLALYIPMYQSFGNIAPQLATIPLLCASAVAGRRVSAGILVLLLAAHVFFQLAVLDGGIARAFHPTVLIGFALGAAMSQGIIGFRRVWDSLRQERDLLRSFMEANPDNLWTKDLELQFTSINQKLAETFGLGEPREAIGKTDFDFLTDEGARERRLEEERIIETGAPLLHHEEVNTVGPGGERLYLTSKVPIRSAEGEVIGLLGMGRDITELKREQELQQQNEELSRAIEARDGFLAQISHELRTPLTSVLGYAQLLQSGALGELNEKQQNAVDSVAEAGELQLELVNDLLDLAQLQTDTMVWKLEPMSVRGAGKAALSVVQPLADEKGTAVEVSWDGGCDLIVGDSRRIAQAFINLLSNAVKFTPEGGTIGIRSEVEDGVVRVTVRDTGIGIAEENFARIFAPFEQLSKGLAREYQGTGLGLALVEKVVMAHEGSLKVESEPGEGSRFVVEFRAAKADEATVEGS